MNEINNTSDHFSFSRKIFFRELTIFLLSFAGLFFILRDHLSDPPFGDDLYVTWNSSYRILKSDLRGSGPFSLNHFDPGHPYLFYFMISTGWRVMGTFFMWPHLLTIFFSSLGLLYAYKLGRVVYHETVGLLSFLLLLCNPMFLATSAMIHLNIPTLTALVLCLYYIIMKKRLALALCLGLLVSFKAYGIVMAFTIYVSVFVYYSLLKPKRASFGDLVRTSIPFLAAPLVFLFFCLVRYLMTGNFLSSPVYSVNSQMHFPDSLGTYWENLKFMSWHRFLKHAEMGLMAGLSLSILFIQTLLRVRGRRPPPQRGNDDSPGEKKPLFLILTFLPPLLMLLFFSIRTKGNMSTYMLPFYPLVYIAFAGLFLSLPRFLKPYFYILVMILCGLNIIRWDIQRIESFRYLGRPLQKYLRTSTPMNNGYLKPIGALQRSALYIQRNYPDSIICASYPEEMAFSEPGAGYVHQPFTTYSEKRNSVLQKTDSFLKAGKTIIFVDSYYSVISSPKNFPEKYRPFRVKKFTCSSFPYSIELWYLAP